MNEAAKDPVEEARKNREKPINKPRTIDPSLTMNERHKTVQEMRERRLAEKNERMMAGLPPNSSGLTHTITASKRHTSR